MTLTLIVTLVVLICTALILFLLIKRNMELKELQLAQDDLLSLMKFTSLSLEGGDNFVVNSVDNSTVTPTSVPVNIPTSFPQVSVLTNAVIQTVPKESFVWLEKTDGLHNNIIIENNKVYSIIKSVPTFLFDIAGDKFIKRTILDTELYDGKYYVFDAAMIDGVDVSNSFFIERMKAAKELLTPTTSPSFPFIMKEYYNVDNWESLLSFINTYRSPITNNVIDGVVCQRIDMPYFTTSKDPSTFKLKRKVMNTIDFYLRYQKDSDSDMFFLYLYGSYADFIFNVKRLPRVNKYMMQHTGVDTSKPLPKSMYTLFASPYKEGLHKFIPRSTWNTNGYFNENIEEINSLMEQVLSNPLAFDRKIVEMSLADDGWVPMRVRDDKQFSNGYAIGLANCGTIFSPVTGKESYFTKKFAFGEEVTNPYHEINKVMRRFIIEKSINSLNRNRMSVLDLAGGRGGDELSLFHAGATNIFAADADRDALVQYVSRTSRTPKMKWEKLLPTTKDMAGKSLLINAIYTMLGKDNEEYIREIKGRFEYPRNGFDVILMNYAIHYICYSHDCVKALSKMVNELLRPGGLFIFSCFDGDAIMKDMKDGKLKLKTFEIEMIDPQMESDVDAKWAKMALPTIDASGYRPEPLVQKEWLKDLQLEEVEHYYPLKECEEYVAGIEGKDNVDDYLKYIQVYVMMKK